MKTYFVGKGSYPERLSRIQEFAARAGGRIVPDLLRTKHPEKDFVLDVHLCLLRDWYTEVCEAAMQSMITILPAALKAEHPQAGIIEGTTIKFLRDTNHAIQGYAATALARAAVLYYKQGDSKFEGRLQLLLRRGEKNPKPYRRAAALHALNYIYRRVEDAGVRASIEKVFRKNGSKIYFMYGKIESPYRHHVEILRFVRNLDDAGNKDAARELGNQIIEQLQRQMDLEEIGYWEAVVEMGERFPDLMPALITQIAYGLRADFIIRGERARSIVWGNLSLFLRSKRINARFMELACRAGIQRGLLQLLAEDLNPYFMNTHQVHHLRESVTALQAFGFFSFKYFEKMVHGFPSPYDLKCVRFFMQAIKSNGQLNPFWPAEYFPRGTTQKEFLASDEFAGMQAKKTEILPLLEAVEKILSSIYEFDVKKISKQTKNLAGLSPVRQRFLYLLKRDTTKAAKMLGPFMGAVGSLPEGEIGALKRAALLNQLHALSYSLFNVVLAEIRAPELGIIQSVLLATRALGLNSPGLDHALKLIEGKEEPSLFELTVINHLLMQGLIESTTKVEEDLGWGVREAAGDALAETKGIQFFTDNFVRSSVLHALSRLADNLKAYLDRQDVLSKAPWLQAEFQKEISGNSKEKSGAKLIGVTIDLAKGEAPLTLAGMSFWFEETERGMFELYLYQEAGEKYGAAFLNGERLTAAQTKQRLGVSASDGQLMAMWRLSD